ncbi:PucR family transcriptional regulator [Saccharopolyspora pogona]|uniref:PucR family transcriptional regulator n=1 Tax=Saccharopolyspora pogona TaxID=333966 RepID=UPI001CC26D9A|nr:helix-turn-helix domain-containing protein [Saccharopolyspora pogona]
MSLLQAAHAAEVVSSRAERGWMTHEQLSSPALLGPVLDHDECRGSDLLPSLAVFLDAGGRWQEAAQHLHVHINTLRHRMSRVEELTGRSLFSTADRVDLYLALEALRQS